MPVNTKKMRADAKRMDDRKSRSGGDFWSPKEGRNLIRIMPPRDPKTESYNPKFIGDWYKEASMHWVTGANRGYLCLKTYDSSACFLCEMREKLRAKGDKEGAKGLNPRTRYYMNVVDLDDTSKGVQVLNSGVTIVRALIDFFEDDEYGDLTDPKKGYNIVLRRTGTGLDTDYNVRPKKNPSKMENDDWLKLLLDLDGVIPYADYEEQKSAFLGTDLEDEDDDEDDDEDEDEDEEDEDEVNPPKGAPHCFAFFKATAKACQECGYSFECESDTPIDVGKPPKPRKAKDKNVRSTK